MEALRQSNGHQRKHQHRPTESAEQHRRSNRRTRGLPEHIRDIGREQPRYHSYRDQLIREALTNPPALSRDDDYIRRWLENAGADANEENINNTNLSGSSSKRKGDGRQASPDLEMALYAPEDSMELEKAKKRKREYNSSSDSSLLDTPGRQRPRMIAQDTVPYASIRRDEPSNHRKTNREGNSSDSEPQRQFGALSSSGQRSFEKRPRHKTREDRYEPRSKETSSHRDGVNKRSHSKRAKKTSKRKATKKGGEDLMCNFSSKSIGQERLTIRPSHGPGLFINGRASSPARRRGVPDLAFSEMDFLQHSSRHQPTTKEDENRSKSREKVKRKALKTQDEISTFFRSKRAPSREIEYNRQQKSSQYTKNEPHVYEKQIVAGQGRLHSQSQSFDLPERLCHGFGNQGLSPGRISYGSPAISYHRENASGSISITSDMVTSNVSWSETQWLPGATATKLRRVNDIIRTQNTISPTPDPIRKSLEETGIFRGPGIRKTTVFNRFGAGDSPSEIGLQSLARDWYGSPAIEMSPLAVIPRTNVDEHKSTRLDPRNQAQGEDPDQTASHTRSNAKQHTEVRHVAQYGNPSDESVERGNTANDFRRIEHFDQKLGFLRRTSSEGHLEASSTTMIKSAPLERLKVTPVSREQIAKNARIKRLSIATPLTGDSNFAGLLAGQAPLDEDKQNPKLPSGAIQTAEVALENDGRKIAVSSILKEQHSSNSGPIALTVDGSRSHTDMQTLRNPNLDHLELDVERAQDPYLIEHQGNESALSGLEKQVVSVNEHLRFGLPVRGSWIDRGFMQTTHSRRLSPVIEAQSLFTRQMQLSTIYEGPNSTEDDPRNQYLKDQAPAKPSAGGLSHDDQDDEEYWGLDVYVQDHDQSLYENYDEVENDPAGEIFERHMSQPSQDKYYQGQEVLEAWNGLGYFGQRNINVGTSSVFARPSRMPNEHHKYVPNQGCGEMQEFWRPHRQY